MNQQIVSRWPSLHALQGTPDLPEAFAIMGFAFYCQPMLLPLLHEMPHGPRGLKVTSRATAIAIFVVANVVFGVLGFFGAARYGLETQGNILVNAWIGGRGEGVLDLIMTAYLAVSAVIVQVRGQLVQGFTCRVRFLHDGMDRWGLDRCSLDRWV